MPVTADELLVAARSAVRQSPPGLLDALRLRHGFEEDDLVQEGAMAGWKAMDTAYRPEKGKPCTFLTMRAHFALRHLARQGGLVKTPRGAPSALCGQFRTLKAGSTDAIFSDLHQHDLIAAPPEREDPAALWDDARPLRRDWQPLTRLWAYLVAVEGMSRAEVAGLWGVNPSTVQDRLRPIGMGRLTKNAA